MMSKKLADKLFKKYPKMLLRENLPYQFECHDGWYWLIDNLCNCIQNYTDSNKKPQVIATQIKQKFGGLRFYTQGTDDLTWGMIWFAESLSYSICEKCGEKGKLREDKGRWYIETLCNKCEEENERNKNKKRTIGNRNKTD